MIEFNVFKTWSKIDNNLLRFRKIGFNTTTKEGPEPVTKGISNHQETTEAKITLPEKQFKERRSLLTELFDDNVHVNGVYKLIILFFSISVLTYILKEFIHHGRFPMALILIYNKFGKIDVVLSFWIVNNILTISMYYCFLFWEKIRQKVANTQKWDGFCIIILVTYYVLSFYITSSIINKFDLPFASAMILSMESVRFLMKIHAFVRSNVGNVLNKRSDYKNGVYCPPVSKFIYFLYAPTAVYKNEYPRTASIRWNFVLYRMLEILAITVFYAICFDNIAKPLFEDSCMNKVTLLDLLIKILEFSVPSSVILIGVFFTLLHSTQNLVGELLGFGDRMFYSDWWTCTDLQQYYKKWNMVIGDWLYTYTYKDINIIMSNTPKTRDFAKLVTIVLSALVHEWICTVTTGYFFPIILASMIISALLCVHLKVQNRTNVKNTIALFIFIMGSSIISSLYGLEYFARENLNMQNNLLPVFLTQNCISLY